MATKRQLGVEFLREGFRTAEGDRNNEPGRVENGPDESQIARKRAALLYSPAILRTLRKLSEENKVGVSLRDLFREVREQLAGTTVKSNFDDFQLALSDVYDDRYVEMVGKDDVEDPLYSITRLGLSVAPP